MDFEIIKDNALNSKTQTILDHLADSYLKEPTCEVKFKYKKYKWMLKVHNKNAEIKAKNEEMKRKTRLSKFSSTKK